MPAIKSASRQLWWGAIAVVSLGLLAKLCGALKEVVTAKTLGTSEAVDQFVFAFTIATWPAGLATSVLVVTLTPLLAKMQQSGSPDLPRFMAQLCGVSLGLSMVLGVVLTLVFPMLSPVAQAGGGRLALMVGAVCVLSCMTALFSVILVARNMQIGTLLEGLPALVISLALLAGIWQANAALIYGAVLGLALQLAVLWRVHGRYVGPVRLAWPQRANPHWRQLASGLGYSTAGYALHATVSLADLAIASRLDAGSVAALSYAGRITALAMGLASMVVYRVAIVHFCQAQLQHAAQAPRSRAWQGVLTLFTLSSLAVSAVLIYFSDAVVVLLFQRGEFNAQASETVAHLMRWGVACLAPYVATAVLSAYLSAVGGFKQIFVSCVVCFGVHMAVLVLASPHYGLTAVVVAPLVGHLVMLVYLWLALIKRERSPNSASALSPAP
jgi:putative peptidoglycan lipid II flippase